MKSRILSLLLGSVVCVGGLAGTASAQKEGHLGMPIDWSFAHVIHHNAPDATFQQVSRQEPRILYNWMQSARARQQAGPIRRLSPARLRTQPPQNGAHTDWRFTLGQGTVAANMSPAKFSFDINATPDCSNDYELLGLNTAGSATQPNLVGFNNLYAGTASANISAASESGTTVTITTSTANNFVTGNPVIISGITPAGYNGTFTITVVNTTTFTYTDTAGLGTATVTGATATQNGLCGVNPSVKWAYNVSTAGGSILTSPALSLDGTEAAFIESATGSAVFHVLKLGTATEGSFSGVSNTYTAATPGSGGSNATLLSSAAFGNGDTLSSPFIDYHLDVAYFGDNNGNLYKTNCVFTCIVTGTTLTVSTAVAVAPTGTIMASPVVDVNTSKIFVGGSNGVLYMVPTSCFTGSCAMASAPVGFNGANGAVIDGVLLDNTFQTLFVTAGNTAGGLANAVQLNESMATLATVAMGTNVYNIARGALDDEYYNNAVGNATPTGNGYFCGPFTGSGFAGIYSVSFSATGTLSVANPPVMALLTSVKTAGNIALPCSPLLTFTSGATERLFFSHGLVPSGKCTGTTAVDGCLYNYTITPSTGTIAVTTSTSEHGGTSAMIVDNVSTAPQAASLYFATKTATTGGSASAPSCTIGSPAVAAFCAVKVTQAGLQ